MMWTNNGWARRPPFAMRNPGSTTAGHPLNQVDHCEMCDTPFVPGFPHGCRDNVTDRYPDEPEEGGALWANESICH